MHSSFKIGPTSHNVVQAQPCECSLPFTSKAFTLYAAFPLRLIAELLKPFMMNDPASINRAMTAR